LLVYNKSEIQFDKIVKSLKLGSTICYPTETLYGIGCIANNYEGIEKIYEIKKRDREKNFTLLFKDLDMLSKHCNIKDIERELILNFSPGPFSILLEAKKSSTIDSRVINDNNKICCRISPHIFVKTLFEFIDLPIISTSANISGNKNIFLFKTIYNTFHNLVDFIIDYGDIPESLGSTIVMNTRDGLIVLREGDLDSEIIKDFYNGQS
tara:strand:+ start:6211 stop:6837 length:627 start_codon:yes stop_codon:yes gene_type:complete